MLLFSSALAKHKLTFTRLSDCIEHIPLAAKWAEEEWGYIRNKGVEYREGVMHSLSHDVSIVVRCAHRNLEERFLSTAM